MNTELTRNILCHDKYFGRQLISFNTSYRIDYFQAVAQIYFIAKNKDGQYGIIGGGNNNIGSFIGWCTGLTSWCFNPIDINDYIWSKENNAFLHKNYSFLKNIPIRHGQYYHYEEDDNDEIVKFFKSVRFLEEELLCSKNEKQI